MDSPKVTTELVQERGINVLLDHTRMINVNLEDILYDLKQVNNNLYGEIPVEPVKDTEPYPNGKLGEIEISHNLSFSLLFKIKEEVSRIRNFV